MICYVKGARLTALAATPGMTWDGLGAEDRRPIRLALVRDQGALCAYCQRRIEASDDPATGRNQMTIEHWIPRSESAAHHFTWSNLLGVCRGTSAAIAGARSAGPARHCDVSRGNRKLSLHPVKGQGLDPRDHLRYTKAGRIESAAGDERVEADIRTLNLNAWQLVRRSRDGAGRRVEASRADRLRDRPATQARERASRRTWCSLTGTCRIPALPRRQEAPSPRRNLTRGVPARHSRRSPGVTTPRDERPQATRRCRSRPLRPFNA